MRDPEHHVSKPLSPELERLAGPRAEAQRGGEPHRPCPGVVHSISDATFDVKRVVLLPARMPVAIGDALLEALGKNTRMRCGSRGVLFNSPMSRHVVDNRESTARDHLANERTYLAWVRTSLGLVGLGVLLERLGAGGEREMTVAAGVGFVGFGGSLLLYAVARYLRVAKNLEEGTFPVARRGPIAVGIGALLVVAGAMLYVLLLR